MLPPPISTTLVKEKVCPPPPRPSQNGKSFSWASALIPSSSFTWADVPANNSIESVSSK